MYLIYQIPSAREGATKAATDKLFMNYVWTAEHGGVKLADYRLRYASPLDENISNEEIYEKFNRDDRPAGRTMHSLSVSDIIINDEDGEYAAWFCDSIGFRKLEPMEFLWQSIPAEAFETLSERGERNIWFSERNMAEACASAIEEAIDAGWDGMYMHISAEHLETLTKVFGYPRLCFTLAAAVRSHGDWDKRIKRGTRNWAELDLPPAYISDGRPTVFLSQVHPVVLDGAVRQFSEYCVKRVNTRE